MCMVNMQIHGKVLLLLHLRRGWWEITNTAESLLPFGDVVKVLLDIGIEL